MKTNKARITYRFDTPDRKAQRPPERSREPQVIPLHSEEFRVVEEQAAPQQAPDANEDDNDGSLPRESQRHLPAEPIVLSEYTSDFTAYRSPFDVETERVERMIRESQRVNGETGYVEHAYPKAGTPAEQMRPLGGADLHANGHNETYREPFANGYEGHRYEQKDSASSYDWGEPQIGTRYAKSSATPPWTRIMLSVIGAVVTGVLFGFVVLSMFTEESLPFGLFSGDKVKDAAAAGAGGTASGTSVNTGGGKAAEGGSTAAAGEARTPADDTGGQTGQTSTAAAMASMAGNVLAVNVQGRSYAFLQHGIFSSDEAAQIAQAELKKKGFASASVAEPGDKTTVYAGFALQKEDAVQLSRKLKADKLEVFVKAVTVPAAPKLNWSGKASAGELATYFQQGDKLVQMIGSLTVLHLGETKPTAIEAATLDAIKTTHQSWIAASSQVKAGVPDTVASALQQMATSLHTAVMSMDEYRKNAASSYLWQSQSAIMQYVLAERGLLASVAAE